MLVAVEATALRFATAVKVLGSTARRLGLVVPAFRSPPRLADADRTLRRTADGRAVVSVRRRGRPWSVVLADLIDGVLVANALVGATAESARSALWGAAEAAGLVATPTGGAGSGPTGDDGERRRHPGRVARRPSLRALPGGAAGVTATPRSADAA